jgi:hypothetical protein
LVPQRIREPARVITVHRANIPPVERVVVTLWLHAAGRADRRYMAFR